MRTVAIIQARLSSTRLPRKMLADINGHPLLWRVVNQAKQIRGIDLVIVAAPTEDAAEFSKAVPDVAYYFGESEDVLARLWGAACAARAHTIIRLTGDCPLLDPQLVGQVLDFYRKSELDFACNTTPPTYPDGLDCEVFSINTLHIARHRATLKSDREHVTPFMWRYAAKRGSLSNNTDLSAMRWCVDDETDLAFVRAVLAEFPEDQPWNYPPPRMRGVLGLLDRKPEIAALMGTAKRNEGYEKSLREDAAS